MDRWRYFDITHRTHDLCNPTSWVKLDAVIELLDLPPGARVLDIGCGKAEFLLRVMERWEASGVGVDLSPFFLAEARRSAAERGYAGALEFVQTDGADYDAEPHSFDLTVCLGASWIWQGFHGTLEALAGWTKEGGAVLVGETFWRQDPAADYLEASGLSKDAIATHAANVEAGGRHGLVPLLAIASNFDEWDWYESRQWLAAERWAAANPDDPDRETLVARQREERDAYLRWGRDTLGWALYLFRN